MWKKLAIHILNYPKYYLLGIFLVLVFFVFSIFSNGIQYSNTQAQLLPDSDSANIHFNSFREKFGKEDASVLIGFYEKDFQTEKQFSLFNDLKYQLKKLPGVKNVFSSTEAIILKKDTINQKFTTEKLVAEPVNLTSWKTTHQKIKEFPFYEGILYNSKTNTQLLIVNYEQEVLDTKLREQSTSKLNDLIENFEKDSKIELYASGMPLIRTMNKKVVLGESKQFVFLALFATIFAFLFFVRSLKATFGIFLVVLMSILCSFGTIAALGYKITILTGLVPPIIIIIGVTNGVFIVHKFFYEYRKNNNKAKALIEAISKIGRATLITNLTTAFGFFTFVFTESSTLKEFGIVSTINILLVFLLCLIFLPIFLSTFKFKAKNIKKELKNDWNGKMNQYLYYLIENKRNVIYSISIILFMVSIYGISLFKHSSNILDEMSKNAKYYKEISFFDDNFGGILPLEIVVSGNPKSATNYKTLEQINELALTVDSLGNSSKLISLAETVKFSKQAFYNNDKTYYDIPSRSEKTFILRYLKNSDGNKNQLKSYVDENQSTFRMTTLLKNSSSDELEKTVSSIEKKVKVLFPEKEAYLTGTAYLFMKGTSFLTKDLIQSIILALFVISLLMATMFRSFPIVIISLIPNVLSMVIVAGMMGFLEIPIKPSTILVFSISFGIAADDTIQFLNKYKQEFYKHQANINLAVKSTFKEMARSMYSSSIVLMIGFGTFLFSGFGGIQALGGLVALVLFFAMFANILILPALLITFQKFIKGKNI